MGPWSYVPTIASGRPAPLSVPSGPMTSRPWWPTGANLMSVASCPSSPWTRRPSWNAWPADGRAPRSTTRVNRSPWASKGWTAVSWWVTSCWPGPAAEHQRGEIGYVFHPAHRPRLCRRRGPCSVASGLRRTRTPPGRRPGRRPQPFLGPTGHPARDATRSAPGGERMIQRRLERPVGIRRPRSPMVDRSRHHRMTATGPERAAAQLTAGSPPPSASKRKPTPRMVTRN
jgi:hypothetical protein